MVAVDASAYFSRPGPRLVDGLELMAHILHPGLVPEAPGAALELAALTPMVVDAWMQHPTERLFRHPMLAPLMRWTGQEPPRGEIPLAVTLEAMDAGGVDRGLISAWTGPEGDLISNDEVAGWVAQAPDRLAGLASVDLRDPVRAVRELRRCVTELGFKGLRVVPWLWGCRRTTAATTRSSPSAWSWASRSAPRSATPGRCAAPRPAGRSPTSTTSRSTSPT